MPDSTLTRVAVVVGLLALTTAFGWWRRRLDGRIRPVAPGGQPARPGPDAVDAAPSAVLSALGVCPGAVTLVQFSSAFCAPCRATRRVLEEVTGRVEGARLVEVDVERHLDAVRELGVWRTPTVLVVDGAGRVVQRASGVPGREDLVAALRPLLAGAQP